MKLNTSKKWFRTLLVLSISFAMVIGIFGGMKLDAKAAGYTLHLASPEEIYSFINGQIFKSEDTLTIDVEGYDTSGNKTLLYTSAKCFYPIEGGYSFKYLMFTELSPTGTISFSDFSDSDIALQWKCEDINSNDSTNTINIYFELVGVPSPNPSVASSSQSEAAPSTPSHECSFQWVTTVEPQPDADGLEEYKCTGCGAVQEQRSIPASMASVKNLFGFVNNVPENGTVTTDFGRLHTISDYLLKKMAERNDATVTIQFEYKNQKLQITFPAGTDYTPVMTDTDTMYGFYGVASKLGLTVTERQ